MTDTPDTQETGETTTTLEEANAAGFLGTHPDPVPNEEYTVAGVVEAAAEAAKDTPQSVEDLGSGSATKKGSGKS
jgi:hypothetical protein